jgi:hypothetical protein
MLKEAYKIPSYIMGALFKSRKFTADLRSDPPKKPPFRSNDPTPLGLSPSDFSQDNATVVLPRLVYQKKNQGLFT